VTIPGIDAPAYAGLFFRQRVIRSRPPTKRLVATGSADGVRASRSPGRRQQGSKGWGFLRTNTRRLLSLETTAMNPTWRDFDPNAPPEPLRLLARTEGISAATPALQCSRVCAVGSMRADPQISNPARPGVRAAGSPGRCRAKLPQKYPGHRRTIPPLSEDTKKADAENPANHWVCLASAVADLPLSYPARTRT
jgi:hypothetical protein